MAWDPVANKIAWRVRHAAPSSGGVLSTAGGIVFQGNSSGEFVAYRASTGARLWSFDAQTGIVAAPVSYEIAGEQYVAVMAGWGGGMAMTGGVRMGALGPNRVLIFKLDGKRTLSPKTVEAPLDRRLPDESATPAQIALGADKYFVYCSICHGVGAVSGGIVPDLRHSGFLGSKAWDEIVLHGALSSAGMTGFDDVLDAPTSAAIGAYVVAQAHVENAKTTSRQP